MTEPRPVFFISDGTGITAETIGHSLLTQFSGLQFRTLRISFVDSPEKAMAAAEQIKAAGEHAGLRPIVVSSAVDQSLSRILADSGALMLDIFAPFIQPLEIELGTVHHPRSGQAHGMVDFAAYEQRINATNYALTHDDGVDPNYNEADLILVGVSRSGKTPTSLYMALQFGVHVANYPLTEDDFDDLRLPASLREHKAKLFGLTIDPERLSAIRNERRANSTYSSLSQCQKEVRAAEAIFNREGVPFIRTTHASIEELSTRIMAAVGIKRRTLQP